MSGTPRPLGRFSSSVALLAVVAITTGWNLPPSRPDHDAVSAFSVQTVDRPSARTAERLSDLDRERATAWAAAWDARAAWTPPIAPTDDDPPGARVRHVTLQGERLVPAVESVPASEPRETTKPATSTTTQVYSGKNHFWFPAIGISRDVVLFPCDRKRPPDNYLYRWGCAGRNNVYLLGHAHSVFKKLHDAYVQGRLRVGMTAFYADGNGRVRKYRITEWRVVDPAEGVHWAIAAQRVPSMTLQTCVGKYSQWRLNVRLVVVN
jgi:hypothetical protein